MIKKWRQARAYNKARIRIINVWRVANRANLNDKYSIGYRDGLDKAVRILADELADQ